MDLGPLNTPPKGGSNAATIQEGSLSYINQTGQQHSIYAKIQIRKKQNIASAKKGFQQTLSVNFIRLILRVDLMQPPFRKDISSI